jgi:nucleoside-diphosphate-sugar epimerase
LFFFIVHDGFFNQSPLAKKSVSVISLTQCEKWRRAMKVTIIGCGYVGKALAHSLCLKSDFTVTVTTTRPERVAELDKIADRVVVMKGDNDEAMAAILQQQDIVILSVGAVNPDVYEETYLYTAKTLVSALKFAPTVRQVIYTGSYSVYGDRKGEWVNEESLLTPANYNGEILARTEQVLLSASNPNRKICILRLGGIYGPERELVKIFGGLAGKIYPGTGKNFTNLIHRDDIINALLFAIKHQLRGIYNLTNDVKQPFWELLDKVFETHNLPKVCWDDSVSSLRPYNMRVCNQKLKTLGYQLAYPAISYY